VHFGIFLLQQLQNGKNSNYVKFTTRYAAVHAEVRASAVAVAPVTSELAM